MKHTKWMLSVLFVTVLSCFVSAGVYASAAESATITSGCISAIFSVTISSSASVEDTRRSTEKPGLFRPGRHSPYLPSQNHIRRRK